MLPGLKVPNAYDFNQTATDGSSFWIEEIANISPAAEEWSAKFANCTLYAYVSDFNSQSGYDFINSVLGYAYVEADKTLKRVNPIQHPKYPNLRATRITDSRGIVYTSRSTTPADLGGFLGPQEFAKYNRRLVAVEFAPCPYKLLDGSDIEDSDGKQLEWYRNVVFNVEPNIYDVTIQVGTFKYAEGAAGNPGPVGPLYVQFPGEVNFLEVKTTLELVWKLVPEDYIMNTVLGEATPGTGEEFPVPTKISAAAGKVNSAIFDKKPIGTLLILEPKIDRYLSGTLRSQDNDTPVFMCDVILPIVHFDPATYGNFKGHNTKPWWNKAAGTFTYHLVSSDGSSTATARIYQEYDYKKIFEHWSV